MREQHGNAELIKAFAPDDAALWADTAPLTAAPADSPPDRGQSTRGFVLVALVAVFGAIVGAVALGDDNASDSAATTTIAAAPTSVRPLLNPGGDATTHYLIDDPSLTAYSADIVTPPPNDGQVQVWTNGTAGGPLVTIEFHHHPYESYGIVGATRDVVEGVELVRPIGQPDTAISEVAIEDEWSATVRATRLSDAEVARVVNSIRLVDGELTALSDVMQDLQLGVTFEVETIDDLVFGRVESTVRYLTADGELATLRAAVGEPDNQLAGFLFLVAGAQRASYDRAYGRLDNGDAIVVWQGAGALLSLVAPGDPDDLIAISHLVRPATNEEWSTMVYGLRPDYTLGDFETLATGTATSTELWAAGPQIAERAGRTEFLWWWTVPGRRNVTDSTAASWTVGTRPIVETVVVPGAMFAFVSQPSAGGTVEVHTASGVAYEAELVQPFDQSPMYMTVVRIEELGPVTVEIDGLAVEQ